METTLREGDISFTFQGNAVKFDETRFYRYQFQSVPGGKGVDFLSDSSTDIVLFLEVKDCRGDERNNMWRVIPNNKYREKSPNYLDVSERDSLDIEAVKKVTSTIACLYGKWTTVHASGIHLDELKKDEKICCELWEEMQSREHFQASKKLRVILFLEGEFGSDSKMKSPQWRTKKQIKRDLRMSIQEKLSWLPCVVEVVDSGTYKRTSGYTVELHPHTVSFDMRR